ncbi:MAG TPA: hypothetical protein VNN22_00955 [Verrucomicrobiae bacterium]|nr:hypothetical protein [Verrucomicrobiae bacterium]
MKTRIEAGTDIAMIGAWDAGRNDAALAGVSGKKLDQVLEEDCTAGNLFLLRTGADGGGPVDVYVDSAVPDDVRKQCRAAKREFLIFVPSGRLVIGGIEEYRSGPAKLAAAGSVVAVPGGNYALRCLVPKGEIHLDPPTRAELEATVGAEDSRYYRRIQMFALSAYFGVPLLFAGLIFLLGWKKALTVAAAVGFICYGLVRLISRNERFRRVARAENELWQQAHQRGLPTLIFELRRVSDTAGLSGGALHLKSLTEKN